MIIGLNRIIRENINTKNYWNQRYLEKNTNNGTSALESILEWVDSYSFPHDFSAIDLGSGPLKPGSFMVHLKKKFPNSDCHVFDISDEMVKSWEGSGISYKTGELSKLDFNDNMFDMIICSHVLEHVTEIEEALSEIKRISKDGSIVIINSPIGIGWSGETEHVWWIDKNINFRLGELISFFEGNQYHSLVQIYKIKKG